MSAHVQTGALVITLTGGWNVAQAHVLRRALARHVVHLPPYVVLDRTRQSAGALLPVLVFNTYCRNRGIVMVICGSVPVLRLLLRRAPGGRVRAYPSLAEALGALRPYPCPPRVRRAHLRMAPGPEAPAAARRMVRECCRRWGVEEGVDNGQLVVSELVANAAEHAGTDIDVTVSQHRGRLRIAVGDRSRDLPAVDPARAADPTRIALAERGRGLDLVSRSASGFGILPATDGKIVWASVPVTRSRGGVLPRRIPLPSRDLLPRLRAPRRWRRPVGWLVRPRPVATRPRLA
ncbi:ATP-binding protein [Plantactinospora sp. KBS50]|uniref:ATP-binding protein n=1 Tax=Plantactinospora sp. KBS50 TaxID=2024580 RepID=UPI0012FE7216|nr:ATP-binding protein [Plantactinospora sp. KBS50]